MESNRDKILIMVDFLLSEKGDKYIRTRQKYDNSIQFSIVWQKELIYFHLQFSHFLCPYLQIDNEFKMILSGIEGEYYENLYVETLYQNQDDLSWIKPLREFRI